MPEMAEKMERRRTMTTMSAPEPREIVVTGLQRAPFGLVANHFDHVDRL